MNSIFRIKSKIHKFVNIAFYLIFFIIGFLVGGGNFEKISTIINNFIN